MDSKDLPPNVEEILKKASKEILENEEGCCFSVENNEQPSNEDSSYSSAYDNKELAEFYNFDMMEEECDDKEPFSNLIANSKHEDITGDCKVLKILLDPGIGQCVPEGSIVMLHYIAYVEGDAKPFDVTYLQGRRPKRFTLGVGELLPGLEIGVKTMTIGENARFIIKHQLAYREMGCPPRIQPKATVLFDVHLVTYFSVESCLTFDEENRDPNRFAKTLTKVKKLHSEGNEQFKLKCIEKAVSKYNRAKELLHMTGCNSDAEEIEMMKYLNKLYGNLSICYLKQCAFNKVCRMGLESMKYSERFSKHNSKIFFSWGKALRFLKDFTEAKNKLLMSLKLSPGNEEIQNELQRIEKDKEFNYNIESFTFKNDEISDEHLPSEFWDMFDARLLEFINSEDEVLTVTLNKNPNDIELAKRKASSFNLRAHVVTKGGMVINCLAIEKISE